MRRCTHKDTLDFLQQVTPGVGKGQMHRRICVMASLIHACARNIYCGLESLCESSEAHQAEKN